MKKTLVAVVFIFSLLSESKAQIGAGKFFIAGTFGVSVDKTKSDSAGTITNSDPNFSFGFYPKVGYFVNDKVAIGGGMGYLGTNSARGAISAGIFGISPFVRRYYKIGDVGNLYVFLQMSVDIGFGHSKTTSNNPASGGLITTKSKLTSFGFGIAPGFTLFPSKRLATEFTFGYIPFSVVDRQNYLLGFTSISSRPIPNPKNDKKTNYSLGFGFRSIISTSLTFKIYLGGKKAEPTKTDK